MQQIKQPFTIRILTWLAAFSSMGMFLSILLAVMDFGPHIMGGERVTRSEWLRIAAPLVGSIGCLMALIAYALRAGKTWSRHVVMAAFSLSFLYASTLGAPNLLRHTIQ